MLCTGRALIQAADQVAQAGQAESAELIGVDLVGGFDPAPAIPGLELVCAPVTAWTPARSFDLITCVHGLHYLGDKLAGLTPRRQLADRHRPPGSPKTTLV